MPKVKSADERVKRDEMVVLAVGIKANLQAGRESVRQGLARYHAAGVKLLKARDLCPHGTWRKWLGDNFGKEFGLTDRTAQRYMALAKNDVTSDLEEAWRRICGNSLEPPRRPDADDGQHDDGQGSPAGHADDGGEGSMPDAEGTADTAEDDAGASGPSGKKIRSRQQQGNGGGSHAADASPEHTRPYPIFLTGKEWDRFDEWLKWLHKKWETNSKHDAAYLAVEGCYEREGGQSHD